MAQRKDLSDWLIHFVHDRQTEDEAPAWDRECDVPSRYSVACKGDGKPIFTRWPEHDEFYTLPHDAHALSVMSKILSDGHIRAGWSFRRGKPTIYGPRAAVCFTEMPLYALLDYAKSRADGQEVNTYGIALPKAEMFQAGARPVIYGLSGKHVERPGNLLNPWRGPRLLADSCGINFGIAYCDFESDYGLARLIRGQRITVWGKDQGGRRPAYCLPRPQSAVSA